MTPQKVLITGGREIGGLTSFAAGLSEGFTSLGIENEIIPPGRIFDRRRALRDFGVLKILSTGAVFAAPFARRAICVAHGVPRADAQGWLRTAAILSSFKVANSSPDARLVAVSDYTAAHLRPFKLKVDGVIRNPVRSCFLEPSDGLCERRYLTYVGRLVPWKNIHRLLPAMCDLQKEHPQLRICVIGDGPQREELESSFRTDPPIEFTGHLDACSVRSFLRRTKVFVSGDAMEPLGITYLEALMQGCAVAMPACGGGVEIALGLIGSKVYLLPLSFGRDEVLQILQRAVISSSAPVSLPSCAPRCVAEAYLEIGASVRTNGR